MAGGQHRRTRATVRALSVLAILVHFFNATRSWASLAAVALALEWASVLRLESDNNAFAGGLSHCMLMLGRMAASLASLLELASCSCLLVYPSSAPLRLFCGFLSCSAALLSAMLVSFSFIIDREETQRQHRLDREAGAITGMGILVRGWKRNYGMLVARPEGDRRRAEALRAAGWPIPGWSADYGWAVSTAEGDRRRQAAVRAWRADRARQKKQSSSGWPSLLRRH